MARHADLNMLTALDALLTECSVTRAAERRDCPSESSSTRSRSQATASVTTVR